MKSSTLAIVFLVITIAWIASGGKSVSAPFHTDRLEILPSVGQVRDAESAEAIGRSVLVHLLSPERFKGITSTEAKLEDGIWTVTASWPRYELILSIVIQIRQKTGAIIEYEDRGS